MTAFWDVCRLIVLVLVSINVGIMFEIARMHYRYASDHTKPFHERLLPTHVWRVAVGTMILIVGSLLMAVTTFGQGGDARLPFTAVGNALLLWGFVKLVQYQRGAAR